MTEQPRPLAGPASDAAIPGYLEALGVPGMIDLHVHFMPQNVLDKVWAYFDGRAAHGGPAWPISYRTAEPERVATLRRLGVTRFTTLNYAHRPGMAAWLNEYSAAFAAAHPQAIGSATFFPEPGAAQQVGDALAAGAEVFKVHVQVGNFDPNDPLLHEAWGLLEAARAPVVIHCGNGPQRGDYTGIAPIRRLLERHPGLVLVIAHAGMPDYADFARLALQVPGVHLDTTMLATDFTESFAPMPAGYPELLARLQGKVVLGSDFPNIPYRYHHQLQALHALGLGERWMAQVLWHAPQRLLQSVRPAPAAR